MISTESIALHQQAALAQFGEFAIESDDLDTTPGRYRRDHRGVSNITESVREVAFTLVVAEVRAE